MTAVSGPSDIARRAHRLVALRARDRAGRRSVRREVLDATRGNALLRAGLAGSAPFLAARLGHVESDALLNHADIAAGAGASPARRRLLALAGRPTGWTPEVLRELPTNAGFFPAEPEAIERFVAVYDAAIAAVDVLGTFHFPREHELWPRVPGALVAARALEPYYAPEPWTAALAGRRVLVVHPFAASIARQYARREELFADPAVLPAFALEAIPAVQTIAGNRAGFRDWFEALDHLRDAVAAREFDVALIGAGAYGLPLAAHVKALGRQAVHMGGATQILFGIRGRRWDDHEIGRRFYNDRWVRASPDETPARAELVEDACYW